MWTSSKQRWTKFDWQVKTPSLSYRLSSVTKLSYIIKDPAARCADAIGIRPDRCRWLPPRKSPRSSALRGYFACTATAHTDRRSRIISAARPCSRQRFRECGCGARRSMHSCSATRSVQPPISASRRHKSWRSELRSKFDLLAILLFRNRLRFSPLDEARSQDLRR